MGQPYPPQGSQQPYTERPLRVYGEQYVVGTVPVGAVINPGDPPLYTDGLPRVPLAAGWVLVHPGDWVMSNRYTGKPIEVISDEEFTERFGGGGPGE